MNATSAVTLSAVIPSASQSGVSVVVGPKSAGSSTSATTVNRSSTTSQPTAMWPAWVWRSLLSASTRTRTTVLATASAMPKIKPGRPVPAERAREQRAQDGRDRTLRDGAGNGDPPHRQQFLDVELQADAEHQQDDADLRQLLGQGRVGDEAGRVRADQRAGEQVADDGRKPEALRDVAQDQRGAEASGQRQDQVVCMHDALIDLRARISRPVQRLVNEMPALPLCAQHDGFDDRLIDVWRSLPANQEIGPGTARGVGTLDHEFD